MFVLTSNPNGLGNPGEGLGYAGGNQPYSIAVEFDTWANGSPANDPGYDHIGINSGGQYNHNLAAPVPALVSQANVDDCAWHTVRVVWNVNTNTLSVYFDGVLRQQLVIPNIVGNYFGGNPVVNWGWSAATGGGTNLQQVCMLSQSNWVAGSNYQSCELTVPFQDVSTSNAGSVASWAWSFGDGGTSTLQNPTHTYPGTGTYTASLTITDVNGCTNTYSHPITINPPITLTPTLNPPPCNGGSNGQVSVSASGGFGPAAGLGGYTYSWNGGAVSGPTYIGASAGTYTVSATDGVCTASAQYTLSQPPPLSAVVTHTDASCGLNNGTATITISGGTAPYVNISWAGTYFGSSVSGLAPGLYIADFDDANGCSALLQYSVTIGSLPCGYTFSTSSTPVSCFGGSNGTATLTATGGAPPYNINWSNGGTGPTISGLTAGVYTYNYSNGSGYNTSGSVTVNQPGAAMVADLNAIDMSCANTNDGQAIASVLSGGNAPYNYAWSNGAANNPVASNLSAGPITVTITDAPGCTASASALVTGPPTLSLTISAVNDSCFQSQTGSATANVSGGNAPYLYSWSNISSAQTNLSLGVGSYTVTVTDDKGCTISASTSISEPTALSHTISATNVLCNGSATGTITVLASGGTGAITYNWNPATASGSNPTGLAAGSYQVTIADANNCQRLDSIVITQPASPFTVTASHTNVTCNGAANGSLTINVSGGTAPYSYLGNNIPAGTTTLPGLAPNTYAGNVTDANNCVVAISETITEPGPQSLTMSSTPTTCNGGNDGTATANFVNATGAVNYVWSNTQSGATISGLVANTYSVTATDQNTCTLSATVAVSQPAAPSMTVAITDATCFGGTGTAVANPSGGGPFTYTWSSSAANTQTVNLPAGVYTVSAADAALCNQTASFTINEPSDILIAETHTNLDCFGDTDGDIVLTPSGGTGPNYTYNWSPNVSSNNLASLLAAGVYDITVTDLANCTKEITITLTQPAQPLTINIQSSNVSCFGANDGSITLTTTGATAPYSYSWNPNVSATNTASSLSPALYSITVTDFNGCSLVPTVTISEPNQPLTLTPAQTDLSCFQSNDGIASVSVTGGSFPYLYVWSPVSSVSNSASGLAAGSYSVTVTDNNGCTNSENFTLTEPAALTASTTHTDVLCNGDATGDILLTVSGGTVGAGYTYQWNPNVSTTNSVNSVGAGTYNVTVVDANGCTLLQTAVVAEPPLLTVSALPTDASCFGEASGQITATALGGTPNYTYTATINNVDFVSSQNGQFPSLTAGSYTVLVVDLNNCIASTTAQINEPAALIATVGTTDALCYNASNGQLDVLPLGGTAGYTFDLSNGESNSSGNFTGLAAGAYSVTVTDNNGCSLTDNAVIGEPDSVTVAVNPNPAKVDLGSTIQLNSVTNQSGALTYSWLPAFGLSCYDCAAPVFDGVYTQQYTLTVTNTDGCSGAYSFDVIVIPDYSIFIPNAFTPNGDGANDTWQLFGNLTAIKQVTIQVFNRIGEKVFETNDINFAWNPNVDGYKGGDLPTGVYVYTAQIVWLDNHSDSEYKGSLTIIR
ncbi:MAG: gliding motility-associated C-terminal domain-containing protein [Bacteroidetes bacterium]|nr:gliding motility-associated C-terminal domain-containing protein [Bacteroidota bacterium]